MSAGASTGGDPGGSAGSGSGEGSGGGEGSSASGSTGGAAAAARPVVCHVIVGPPHHGVTRYGLALVDACAASPGGSTHRLVHLADRADLTPPPQVEADIIHVTFTDHLFGPDPEAAARTVARLVDEAQRPGPAAGLLYDPADGGAPAGAAARAMRGTAGGTGDVADRAGGAGGRPGGAADRPRLTVSVHDVPQPAEGEDRFARRARGYAALAEQADVVVVNSAHEAAFFNGEAAVIPLPIEDPRSQPPAAAGREEGGGQVDGTGNETIPTVGLLGFVYPGKGYERVIEAVPSGVRVRALGAVAAGHDDYAAQLRALAAERGVDFEVTGYVPDSELAAALDAITVPVCPHRHVSASGSLNTWIAHNRRVVVADGPYMREVAERWPERVVLAGDEPDALDLASAIASMLDDPTSAWCAEPPPAWGWPDLAAAYAQLWSELT